MRREAVVAIDHVAVATNRPEETAARLTDLLGLRRTHAGNHPDRGTATQLFGLAGSGSAQYLEIITVRQPGRPAAAWLAAQLADGRDRLVACALRVPDATALAARRGLRSRTGRRVNADGRAEQWITARRPDWYRVDALPYFIERADTSTDGMDPRWRLTRVVVGGAARETFRRTPPAAGRFIETVPGPRAIRCVILAGPAGRVRLTCDDKGISVSPLGRSER